MRALIVDRCLLQPVDWPREAIGAHDDHHGSDGADRIEQLRLAPIGGVDRDEVRTHCLSTRWRDHRSRSQASALQVRAQAAEHILGRRLYDGGIGTKPS